jgi:hypothetical protein
MLPQKKIYKWPENEQKNCSASLATRNCKSKPQWEHHFTPTRMAFLKKTMTSVGQGSRRTGTIIYTVGGYVKW